MGNGSKEHKFILLNLSNNQVRVIDLFIDKTNIRQTVAHMTGDHFCSGTYHFDGNEGMNFLIALNKSGEPAAENPGSAGDRDRSAATLCRLRERSLSIFDLAEDSLRLREKLPSDFSEYDMPPDTIEKTRRVLSFESRDGLATR